MDQLPKSEEVKHKPGYYISEDGVYLVKENGEAWFCEEDLEMIRVDDLPDEDWSLFFFEGL